MMPAIDGASLKPLFAKELASREKPLPFRHQGRAAWIDNRYKLVSPNLAAGTFELYDLEADPKESRDLSAEQPEVAKRMQAALLAWNESVKASVAGKDYPEGRVDAAEPPSRDWVTSPEYAAYLSQWKERPEFRQAATKSGKGKKQK